MIQSLAKILFCIALLLLLNPAGIQASKHCENHIKGLSIPVPILYLENLIPEKEDGEWKNESRERILFEIEGPEQEHSSVVFFPAENFFAVIEQGSAEPVDLRPGIFPERLEFRKFKHKPGIEGADREINFVRVKTTDDNESIESVVSIESYQADPVFLFEIKMTDGKKLRLAFTPVSAGEFYFAFEVSAAPID